MASSNPHDSNKPHGSNKTAGRYGMEKPTEKILVAFSGGLESAVTAALLRSQGYEPVALSLQLFDSKSPPSSDFSTRCTESSSFAQAKPLADKLGIPWISRNASALFQDVVVDFCVHERLLGREPIPCLECNHGVLFNQLFEAADELGIRMVSTGHYAQVIPDPIQGGVRLTRAVELANDQSALLYRLNLKQLERLVLPLGGISVNLVNKLAGEFDLKVSTASRSGASGCFYRSARWKEFVQARSAPSLREKGNIHKADTNVVVGEHDGLFMYRVAEPSPRLMAEDNSGMLVIDTDHKLNTLMVGKPELMERKYLFVTRLHWVSPVTTIGIIRCTIQVGMDALAAVPGIVISFEGHTAIIELESTLPTPRQGGFVAFYIQDELIGGAIVERMSMDPPVGLFVEKGKAVASHPGKPQSDTQL